MDDTEITERLKAMEQSIERVYGALRAATEQQAQILNRLNERSQADVSAVHSYMAILGGMHAQEAMLIAPDGSRVEGRWFWGQYEELGFDVKMQRPSSDPT